jgi:hypothetical protein
VLTWGLFHFRILESKMLDMGIYETFSKRNKRITNAGKQEIYQYDDLPAAFRIQVWHIWRGAIGREAAVWETLHDTIAREAGLFRLGESNEPMNGRCLDYMLTAQTEDALNII